VEVAVVINVESWKAGTELRGRIFFTTDFTDPNRIQEKVFITAKIAKAAKKTKLLI